MPVQCIKGVLKFSIDQNPYLEIEKVNHLPFLSGFFFFKTIFIVVLGSEISHIPLAPQRHSLCHYQDTLTEGHTCS